MTIDGIFQRMTCRIRTDPAQPTIVTVAGEVDMAACADLETALRRPVEQGRDVVADLRQVAFIDCTGLRALMKAARVARRSDRALVIRPSEAVRRLMTLTGLPELRQM